MRIIFIGLLLSIVFPAISQDAYSVSYQLTIKRSVNLLVKGVPTDVANNFEATDRLVFDDSLSFWYRQTKGEKHSKAKVFGRKVEHHARTYSKTAKLLYDHIAWPPSKGKYLVYDSLADKNWVFLPGTKNILGYSCTAALNIDENNDSLLVWYTNAIPQPYGPDSYVGFNGLVLEVYNQKNNIHMIATRIEKGDYKVVMPEKATIITRKEYYTINPSLAKKMGL